MIKINIRKKETDRDSNTVAKIILVDAEGRVLLIKRSSYSKKFAKEWDLPGGHLKEGETLLKGLKREVKEETGLDIRDPIYHSSENNLNFFRANYDSQPVKLSHEHTEYKFFKKEELSKEEKFQKIALEILNLRENFR